MFFLTLLIFIFILSILIFVHELGHFWACRIFKIKVEEFGIGFPPRIFKIKTKKTIYSLNLIPIGGFVKIKGEDNEETDKDDPESFSNQPIWQRMIVAASGIFMNIVLTIVLFSFGFMIGLPLSIPNEKELKGAKIENLKIQVVEVLENSSAQKAGILPGDIILKIDNEKISEISSFQKLTKEKKGKEIFLQIKRVDNIFEQKIFLQENPALSEAYLGVYLSQEGIVSFLWYKAIFYGGKLTFSLIIQILVIFYEIIKNLIFGQTTILKSMEVTGPIGIANYTSQMTNLGFAYLVKFVAFLSLNLGIINAFPFPALDGGRILFLGIEKIRRKKSQKLESIIHSIGFILLLCLMAFVTLKDVVHFKEKIIEIFKRIF